MPRDYAKSGKKKKPGQLPGWAWMLGGLLIGLFVAFLVYLNNNVHPKQKDGLQKALKQTINDVREVRKRQEAAPPPPSAGAKIIQDAREFTFYETLPNQRVPVHDEEYVDQVPVKPDQEKLDEIYFLQAASFKQLSQADQLKARLALQGIEAAIQTVTIRNDTWHRVRVGPFTSVRSLDAARRRLDKLGLRAYLVKQKT